MGEQVISQQQADALKAVYAESLARKQTKRDLISIQVAMGLLVVVFVLAVTALVVL